ncbi:hypothetical protein FN846DRAFT_894030 [Sphaerosporella brunnea]|uniref:Uncharacterized protein n=1 Tax=Sphaerosporella brunnea TaxID=1250544 RepID=A0A5J5EKQ3_9PEZI|nr:hypothetical protein FN846DRAFT_894030 [Sphaerosporella brunnea]
MEDQCWSNDVGSPSGGPEQSPLYASVFPRFLNSLGDPVWDPSTSTIQSALDQVGCELSEAPETKTALYEAPCAGAGAPPRTPTYIYSRPNEPSALTIGQVCYILPKELDAALIKARLSSVFGLEKKLCKPRNLLRAPASVSKERNYGSMAEMRKAITAFLNVLNLLPPPGLRRFRWLDMAAISASTPLAPPPANIQHPAGRQLTAELPSRAPRRGASIAASS